MTFHEEQTETFYISIVSLNNKKDYYAEVFIKDEGFVWYAALQYQRMPTRSIIIRDTYAYKCKSPRPYQPGQACGGNITACVFHLFDQLCQLMGIDPLETYRKAYDDRILTRGQFDEILAFAEWQGVEEIIEWNQGVIDQIIESIREANMNLLASIVEEKIPV